LLRWRESEISYTVRLGISKITRRGDDAIVLAFCVDGDYESYGVATRHRDFFPPLAASRADFLFCRCGKEHCSIICDQLPERR
jgi:hypothetical protein